MELDQSSGEQWNNWVFVLLGKKYLLEKHGSDGFFYSGDMTIMSFLVFLGYYRASANFELWDISPLGALVQLSGLVLPWECQGSWCLLVPWRKNWRGDKGKRSGSICCGQIGGHGYGFRVWWFTLIYDDFWCALAVSWLLKSSAACLDNCCGFSQSAYL